MKKIEAFLEAIRLLEKEVAQLEKWATENEEDGWSTWQNRPMRKRAKKIQRMVAELKKAL